MQSEVRYHENYSIISQELGMKDMLCEKKNKSIKHSKTFRKPHSDFFFFFFSSLYFKLVNNT